MKTQGSRCEKRSLFLSGLALALFFAFSLSVSEADSKTMPAVVKINTSNQSNLIDEGGLRMTLRGVPGATVAVSVRSLGSDSLFKTRQLRLNDRGSRKLLLPMTSDGKAKLSRCGIWTVKVRAIVRLGERRRIVRDEKRLKRDYDRCGQDGPVVVDGL